MHPFAGHQFEYISVWGEQRQCGLRSAVGHCRQVRAKCLRGAFKSSGRVLTATRWHKDKLLQQQVQRPHDLGGHHGTASLKALHRLSDFQGRSRQPTRWGLGSASVCGRCCA